MYKIIDYFYNNSQLNHTILVFFLVLGIFAYINIPKEVFPTTQLEVLDIEGSYTGASAESLNNFAVSEIENQLNSIAGLEKITSYIYSGFFSINIKLQDGVDKNIKLNEVKDAVSLAKRYLPTDMEEPNVRIMDEEWSLLSIALSSSKYNQTELLKIADNLKNSLMQIKHINKVRNFGDADLQIELVLDNKKINMYGLNSSSVVDAISQLSYIYPVGNIEQVGNHVYLSANNNKFDTKFWENSILKIDGKKIYLNDIANITIGYPKRDTISRLNGENTLTLRVYKNKSGDSIKLTKEIKELIEKTQNSYDDISLVISRDNSKQIKDRLNTILANITLGLILVAFAMYILISPRLSFVIILGIPFSFIIGLLFLEFMGYSLNMISMMAMLIALGIVVDDAIIVSENIQRHIDDGYELNEAILKGTKQVIGPVIIAGVTTVFAFLSMLFISGEMGLFIKLIPIVITCLILSSIIESFLFLPLHAKHFLKVNEKQLDWTKMYNFYENILHKVIEHKKSFLIIFFITIPIISIILIKTSRFQLFPNIDSNSIEIAIKLENSIPISITDNIAKRYEKVLLDNSKELYIKNISTYVGVYNDLAGNEEDIENGFMILVELEEFREENFVENYINPILNFSFDFERLDKVRLISSNDSMNMIRELIEPLTKQDNAIDHNITSERIGIASTDIEILLNTANTSLLVESIDKLKKQLQNINGVEDIADNTILGESEYKYIVNPYGRYLGLSDTHIAKAVGSFFLEREQANTFNEDGIIKIITKSINKDSIEELKNFYIPLDNDKFVQLKEVVDFKIERNFNEIQKVNGQIYKKVVANVQSDIVNATEVLDKLQDTIKEIENLGIRVNFGGEKEKSDQMALDLVKAFLVSMFLIFITLLIIFPSFKSTFVILSVIPFTILGPIIGHFIMGINLNSQSMIGMLGLAGVVINDGIIMLNFLHKTRTKKEFFANAKLRVRPILITSITTMLGLFTLIFFPTGESIMLQPIAVSLGFGILWGTVLNLVYVPALFATLYKIKD
ncbi:efflux RND transporter permease subunit [Aliarcobacter vitoriensis]|uniref:Multidrug transporter AcrB n=1 Tax=Aliarcobacter vitoriensis TaxID=2011099 RepID=A0A366MUG6_9BACT|nr:efflux RND transporter permease subunit [Aliarcobacter vitoriensis]RBQ29707.1 multidrug transporter AcrB [Aliarcobacter vitoriensis]